METRKEGHGNPGLLSFRPQASLKKVTVSRAGGGVEVSGRCMVGETSGRGTGGGGTGAGRARAESWPRPPWPLRNAWMGHDLPNHADVVNLIGWPLCITTTTLSPNHNITPKRDVPRLEPPSKM